MLTQPPADLLTPSEVVLLTGGISARSGDYSALAADVYAGAFLAIEATGTLTFEPRREKGLFGLSGAKACYACARQGSNPWPDNSLEAGLTSYAERSIHSKSVRVQDIVHAYLEKDSASPANMALDLVRDSLARRKLLMSTEGRYLGSLKRMTYEVPASTTELAERLRPAIQGICDCRQSRPELWEGLRREIKLALQMRDNSD